MVLVKQLKKILIILIFSLSLGFLSGCDSLPAFLTKPDVYEVYSLLDQYYYKDLDFTIDDVATVDEIIERLDDPYTYLYAPNTRTLELGESYLGIGISITEADNGLLITAINKNAHLEGIIYPGDVILKVNDTELSLITYDERLALLRGEEAETFTLTIQRGDMLLTSSVTMQWIALDSVTSYKDPSGVGYIDINRFASTTSDLFKEQLTLLESESITGLIIDVRNNGGGYLTAVANILALFETGTLPMVSLHTVYNDSYSHTYPIENAIAKSYPVVVLMNEHSASASEVLAISLRENQSIPLIGRTSYGKFVFQTVFELTHQGDPMYFNMTLGYWLSPNGNNVEGGIVPDYYVDSFDLFTKDYPYYQQNLTLGDSLVGNEALLELLNMNEDTLADRTDLTTIDNDLVSKILAFQQQQGLILSGDLDYDTQLKLISYYQSYLYDRAYDLEYLYAINYFGGLNG